MKRSMPFRFVVGMVVAAALALGEEGTGQQARVPGNTLPLDRLLDRARDAMSRYVIGTAPLVADERCEQRSFEARSDSGGIGGRMLQPRGRRTWQAELALVPTPELAPTGYPWTEFRDVLVVDGRPVPDHDRRLSTLLQQLPTLRIDQARAITGHSASFNIGRKRNTNTPSVPLLVLAASNAHRFEFARSREATVHGVATVKVTFHERSSPTLVRALGSDCFASGALWIEPERGHVVQAELRCDDAAGRVVPLMTIRYAVDARLKLWVPVSMHEQPFEGDLTPGVDYVESRCGYTNYRRFETGARLIVK